MGDLPLLEWHPPSQQHSRTSVAAADAVKPDAATLRGQVLAYLKKQGREGATDEQMQRALGMNPSTQRPRRLELVRMGFVRDSGFVRPTSSGRRATVWRAVE